jgi:acyl-CoA thioester hydrolase
MSDPDALLPGYPVTLVIPVAWGDMDAFRHVNNTVYFRWFESARIAYFQRVGALEVMEATGVGPILAATRCRFRIPVTFPDRVVAGARVPAASVGDDRFTMEYAVASREHGRVAAEGVGEIVTYDYARAAKAAIPAGLRQRILDLG